MRSSPQTYKWLAMASEEYYKGSKLFLLNFALGLGTFIQILDSSIANVAVPYIAGNLSVSADQGTWVITSFACSNAVVLPLTGWLSDYFGRVRLFVYSVLLFSLTSFLCGQASSLTSLVFFRVLQGAVAGCLIPLSQSLILLSNPPEKRGGALGFWAMIVVVAPVMGPILGGYITQEYSWPWIFYINVPIGIVSAWMTWVLLKHRESEIRRYPIDWTGLILLTVGVSSMQIMLDKGKDLDWFNSNFIIALTIISLVALIYFIAWTRHARYPIVDFSFFEDRNFLLGTIVTTIGYLIFFGSTVTVPLWLQTQENYTAFWAGVAVAPIGIVPCFLSSTVGKLMNRIDVRLMASCSFFFFSIGFFLQALFISGVSLEYVMAVRFFQGFGVVVFFIPLVQLSLGYICPEKYASASGLFNFIRILVGSGFGTSLSIEWWTHFAITHHAYLSETITVYDPRIIELYNVMTLNPTTHTDVVNRLLETLLTQEAYVLATNDLSWLSAWTFLLMVPIPFLCRRVKPIQGAHHAAAD